VSGAGLGGQDAASATSNSTAGRRIPQPPHAKVTGRWLAARSFTPRSYIAAQQIGPSNPFRQEITPCWLWSFAWASASGRHWHLSGDRAPAHRRRVEQLLRAGDEQQPQQFIERVQLARELDGRADKALEGSRRNRRDAEVDIGALRLRVRGCVRTLTDALTKADQLAAAARKAFDKKDQKALTEARTSLIELKAFDANVLRLRPEVQQLPKQHQDLDREQRAEVQWMLDDLERVEEVPAAIGRLVKETMALGQVPVKRPARPTLAAAEAQKLIKTFGLPDDGSRRTKAAKILADDAIEAWPRALAKLYGCKESELKARLGDVRKLSFVRSMSLIDI